MTKLKMRFWFYKTKNSPLICDKERNSELWSHVMISDIGIVRLMSCNIMVNIILF